ncbi:HEAT repeat domain-containing protein [Halosimplex litoreum]|uniref:HEAT repeat domain-containing protein n=1 Tax=Halosimplex litoreum TaxID=1198301 RepID=A0A7T3FYD2_9EURY|nr:HEAT repeat domain-containing protein [Halosimplex litoreum]QPV62558.1 HEAT repeat domain-containing protein [Halosimplex litoreum]
MGSDVILYFERPEPFDAAFIGEFADALDELGYERDGPTQSDLDLVSASDEWSVELTFDCPDSEFQSSPFEVTFRPPIGKHDRPYMDHRIGFWLPKPHKDPDVLLDYVATLGPLFDRVGFRYGHAEFAQIGRPPPRWLHPGAWWRSGPVTFFGPNLVDRVGRKRLLSTPATAVREYKNGSVALISLNISGGAAWSLRDPTARRPKCLGRLPDPPFEAEPDAPTRLCAAVGGLDGWNPEHGPGDSRDADREWLDRILAEGAPRQRASAVLSVAASVSDHSERRRRLTTAGVPIDPTEPDEPALRAALLDAFADREWTSDSDGTKGGYFASLLDDDTEVRRAAASGLATMEGRAARRELVKRVRDDPSPRVRGVAMAALSVSVASASDEELRTVARHCYDRDDDERVRIAALEVAGESDGVTLLVDGLDDPSRRVRSGAVVAFRRALGAGGESPDPPVERLRNASDDLIALFDHDDDGVAHVAADALSATLSTPREDVVAELTDADTPVGRAGAAYALAEANAFTPSMAREGLSDESPRVRTAVAGALANAPETAALVAPRLWNRFESADEAREQRALGLALRSGWTHAGATFPVDRSSVTAVLGSETPSRGRWGAAALAGPSDGRERLRRTAEDTSDPHERGAALFGLGYCGDPDDLDVFDRVTGDDPPWPVRVGAACGLGVLTASLDLSRETAREVRSVIRDALNDPPLDPQMRRIPADDAGLRFHNLATELLCTRSTEPAYQRLLAEAVDLSTGEAHHIVGSQGYEITDERACRTVLEKRRRVLECGDERVSLARRNLARRGRRPRGGWRDGIQCRRQNGRPW